MTARFPIPDGNDALRDDIPAVVKFIERTTQWVNPETFRQLPVWYPYAARGSVRYNAAWSKTYTNTRKATGVTLEKLEGNFAARNSLWSALDVTRPRPKNWTVCHIWGYDDPTHAQRSSIVQDPRYFTCVGNMVWLPTPLKGFTDALPEVKDILRVCAFYLYGWVCEHPSVMKKAEKIRSGWTPDCYPKSWPCTERPGTLPTGTAPYSDRIAREIKRRKQSIKASMEDNTLAHFPRDNVREVLEFWRIEL